MRELVQWYLKQTGSKANEDEVVAALERLRDELGLDVEGEFFLLALHQMCGIPASVHVAKRRAFYA